MENYFVLCTPEHLPDLLLILPHGLTILSRSSHMVRFRIIFLHYLLICMWLYCKISQECRVGELRVELNACDVVLGSSTWIYIAHSQSLAAKQ
jgi:hypothetical protein